MAKPFGYRYLDDDGRDQEYAARFGVSQREYQSYKAQRDSARNHGIDFRFTPLGWKIWWRLNLPAGASRGRKRDQYVMARIGGRGAYEDGNVRAVTPRGNYQDRPPEEREALRRKRLGQPRPHLRIRGDGHPKAQAVLTPAGRFGSAALAAEAHNITRQAAAHRARRQLFGWRYA